MSKDDLSIIDTNKWKLVQSPGLKSPRNQLPYDSLEVQNVLAESFGAMFPSVLAEKDGVKRYSFVNKQGVEQFQKLKSARNISDIPKAEMLRLMEGWIRLRRKLQEDAVPSKVGSILLNFRVPNPRESLDRYMLYKVGDEQRLVIRWGFETKDERSVSLERAISILMDVPLGHMRSILSTTMTATTSTVPVGQMISTVPSDKGKEERNRLSKSIMYLSLASCVALLLGGTFFLNNKGGLNFTLKSAPSPSSPLEIEPVLEVEKVEGQLSLQTENESVVVADHESDNDLEDLGKTMESYSKVNTEILENTEDNSLMMSSLITEKKPPVDDAPLMDEMISTNKESSLLDDMMD